MASFKFNTAASTPKSVTSSSLIGCLCLCSLFDVRKYYSQWMYMCTDTYVRLVIPMLCSPILVQYGSDTDSQPPAPEDPSLPEFQSNCPTRMSSIVKKRR
jgi:hypothetical protein